MVLTARCPDSAIEALGCLGGGGGTATGPCPLEVLADSVLAFVDSAREDASLVGGEAFEGAVGGAPGEGCSPADALRGLHAQCWRQQLAEAAPAWRGTHCML